MMMGVNRSEMKRNKITSHTFLGTDVNGHYKYEITFNQSLHHTVRMNAMTKGLDRFDRWSVFYHWLFRLVSLFPFTSKIQSYLFTKF
jgi:hypothetical protein